MNKLRLPSLALTTAIFAVSLGFAANENRSSAATQACAKACDNWQLACDHYSKMLAEGKRTTPSALMTCQDCASCCSHVLESVLEVDRSPV